MTTNNKTTKEMEKIVCSHKDEPLIKGECAACKKINDYIDQTNRLRGGI